MTKLLSLKIIFLPSLIIFTWLIAFGLSETSLYERFELLINQTLLTVFIFTLLIKTLPKEQSAFGPRLVFVFGLHALIYYGASNIIPSLLSELRPDDFFMRIPKAPTWAYSLATIAAGLMLIGVITGARLLSFLWPPSGLQGVKPYSWLPEFSLSMLSCILLLILISMGTFLYGTQVAVEMLTSEDVANLKLSEQLLFHGLFTVFPIAPILATSAYIKAKTRGQQQACGFLVFIASFLTLLVLFVWGQRSTAMLALAMPIGLLVHARKINLRKTLLPIMFLMAIIYSSVTAIRDSKLPVLLALTSDFRQLSLGEVVSALTTKQNDDQNVAKRAFTDSSYRTAGLEAAAALIEAQSEGRIQYQYGNTVMTGFMNALPSSMRPESLTGRIKTAPSELGVFQPGDWVTTILAEFVLDFGPFFLFFPAIICGLLLMLTDRVLLFLGQYSPLGGLLVIRIVFLIFIISNGGSFAEMTLMLFKGTIGYMALFVFLGFALWFTATQRVKLVVFRHKKSSASAVRPAAR